jgi:hypothetical protein
MSKTSSRARAAVYAGRKRKPNVRRDANGKSRGEPKVIAPEVLAIRRRDLRADGIEFKEPEDAKDSLCGFSLGRLLLRSRQDEANPGSISQSQFDAGQAWAAIVHRHAAIMGYKLNIKTPSMFLVGAGASCASDPDEQAILNIRRRFSDCYNGLMAACRDHGLRVRDVTYGIAVENWPLQRLSESDYGALRVGLNSLARVLR